MKNTVLSLFFFLAAITAPYAIAQSRKHTGARPSGQSVALNRYQGSAATLLPATLGTYTRGEGEGPRNSPYEKELGQADSYRAEYTAESQFSFRVGAITFPSVESAKAGLKFLLDKEFDTRRIAWNIQRGVKLKGGRQVGERYVLTREFKGMPDEKDIVILWRNGSVLFSISGRGPHHPPMSAVERFEKSFPY